MNHEEATGTLHRLHRGPGPRVHVLWPIVAMMTCAGCVGSLESESVIEQEAPIEDRDDPTSVPRDPLDPTDPTDPVSPGDKVDVDPPKMSSPCSEELTPDTGASPLGRFTQREYAATIAQIFELSRLPDISSVPPDPEQDGFTVHSKHQTITPQHLRGYLEVASREAASLLDDQARRASMIGCDLQAQACLGEFIDRFGRLVYRRPVTAQERDDLVGASRGATESPREAFVYAIESMLVAPEFIYHLEGSDEEGAQALTDFELASRLSFALHGRAPSRALIDRVEAGALATPESRRDLVRDLGEDPAYVRHFHTFFEEWLGYAKAWSPREPPQDWSEQLPEAMRAETRAVIDLYAFGGGSLLDMITTDATYMSPQLATFYGLPEPDGEGAVTIPADHPRAGSGLLTHASVLSAKGDGDAISIRGNWLRSTFLCQPLHLPPDFADTLGERLVGLTPVEIVIERNTDGACKGCHAMIDPIGVTFDAFDATGRYDASYEVPDYGVAPGLPGAIDPAVNSPGELARKLSAMPGVADCMTKRTFLYIHGRAPVGQDSCTIEGARQAFVDSGYDYRALIEHIVLSPAFELRRSPAPEEATEQGEAE